MITAEGEKGESLFPSSDKFDTDVHNGSKDGSGTFNYRMLFPVMIPSRLPRLKVQVWDQDLFSADTFIGEANVNMSTFFSQVRARAVCGAWAWRARSRASTVYTVAPPFPRRLWTTGSAWTAGARGSR